MTPELKKKIEEHENEIKFLQEKNKKLFDTLDFIYRYKGVSKMRDYVAPSEYNELCRENENLKAWLENERKMYEIVTNMQSNPVPFSRTAALSIVHMIDDVLENKNSKE